MSQYKKFLLSIIAVALIFSPLARGAVRMWSMTIVMLIELILIFAWLWKANNSDRYEFKKTAIDVPLAVFALLAAVSFIFSVYKHDSFYALLRLLGYIGIYYLVVNEFDHAMRRYVMMLAVCIGTALSIYGLLQYFGIFSHDWWVPKEFLSATYVNHNHFAGYLELAMPLAIGLLMGPAGQAQGRRFILIAALAVMAGAFILTQSRGAWLSLVASFLIMAAVLIKRKKINIQAIFMVFLVVIIAVSFIYFGRDIITSRIDSVAIAQGEEASFATRIKIWQGTIDLIRANPIIGVGIGDFIWAFPRYRPEGLNVQANFAHNDYLETAAEMGIPALFVMLWLLVSIIATAIKRCDSDPVKIGCVMGLLSLSLHGLVDFNFHIPANMLLFTICAAIAMGSLRHDGKREG